MRRDQTEWLFNTLLILAIAGLIALIGMQRFSRPKLLAPVSSAPVVLANEGEKAKPGEGISAEVTFPNLGKGDPFKPIFTPLPTATPRPPKPKRTPSLAAATKGWSLQYPFRRAGQPTTWVFQGRTKKEEFQISEGTVFTLNYNRANLEITAEPGDDRYSVYLKFNDQKRKFSLLE